MPALRKILGSYQVMSCLCQNSPYLRSLALGQPYVGGVYNLGGAVVVLTKHRFKLSYKEVQS